MLSQSSTDALNELVIANLTLDNRMRSTKKKILMKKQEISKLQEEIKRENEVLFKLNQEIDEVKMQENKALKMVEGFQHSKLILERLVRNAQNQLALFQENFQNVISERVQIVDKYRNTSVCYLQTYQSIRLSQEKNGQKVQLSLNLIKLKEARQEFIVYSEKVCLLKLITEHIFIKDIVTFADLMVARRHCYHSINTQREINKQLTSEVESLSGKENSFLKDKMLLAKSGVSLSVKRLPVIRSMVNAVFTPIKERLGLLKHFSTPDLQRREELESEVKRVEEGEAALPKRAKEVEAVPKRVKEVETVPKRVKAVEAALPKSAKEVEAVPKRVKEVETVPKRVKEVEAVPVKEVETVPKRVKEVETASPPKRHATEPKKTVTFLHSDHPSSPKKRKTLRDTQEHPKTVTFLHSDISSPSSPIFMPSKPNTILSPDFTKNPRSPEIFGSYKFPPGTSLSVINSPLSFQPSSGSGEKDFSSIFGGPSHKSDNTSFFNLF